MIGKFKVWDSEKKEFSKDVALLFVDYLGLLWSLSQTGIAKAGNELEVIFSTGKTDKNGVELFDGDIVKGIGGKIMVVFIDGGDVCVKNKYHTNYLASRNYFEKIGNKFENPELMEPK